MFKWGFILLGIFFLWGGIDNHVNYSTPVNEEAEIVDFDRLQELLVGEEAHYISFPGVLDDTGRIYPTLLNYPAYSKFAPWDIQTIDPLDHAVLGEALGAVVEVSAAIQGATIEMETARIEDDEKTASSVVVAAPLEGTNARLWVMSPPFRDGEVEKKTRWLNQATFTGHLSRLDDLNRNNDSRLHKVEDLKRTFVQGDGGFVQADALLIDTFYAPMGEQRQKQFEYYVLVSQTDLRLYAATTKETEATAVAAGTITGVLRPGESKDYPGFMRALGEASLPERIGIISMESGGEVNDDNFFYTKVGVVGGLLFIGIGLLLWRISK